MSDISCVPGHSMDNPLIIGKISNYLTNIYAHLIITHSFDLLPPWHRLLQLEILSLAFVRCLPTEGEQESAANEAHTKLKHEFVLI